MSTSDPIVLVGEIEALTRRLRMPYLRQAVSDVLATAKSQRWDPAEALRALLETEVEGRERSMIEERRRRARFPSGKTFDAWDPARSSIPAATQRALRTLEWVQRKENLVVCGPSGTGKSLLLEALGQAATDAKCTVRWFSIEDLGVLVRRHRVDDSVAKALIPILRADVIVVDDIGLLGISDDAAEGFYRLVDAAYERRSLAVSSNLHPSGFDQLMGKSLATALVDRLLHHAHIIETSGESIRLQDATSGRGVKPLDQ
jgi:DNA replication protein DnaC